MDQEEPLGGQPVSSADDQAQPLTPEASSAEPVVAPMDGEAAPPPPLESEAPPARPAAPPPFTVRLLLKDTFARYAADWVRLLLLCVGYLAFSSAISFLWASSVTRRFPLDLGSFWLVLAAVLVVGVVVTSILFAVVGGGRDVPLRVSVVRGTRRTLAVVGVGLAIVVLFVVAGFALVLGAGLIGGLLRSPLITFVLFAFAFLWLYSVIFRLTIAVPAVVIDELGIGEGLSTAWAATKSWRIWLRMIGAVLLLGLLGGAAGFSTSLLGVDANPIVALSLSVAVSAFLLPLSIALSVSTYRRLVPIGGVKAPPNTVGFMEPLFGTAARRLVGLSLVLAVVGAISAPIAFGRLFGQLGPAFPPFGQGGAATGQVAPGKVVFGSTVAGSQCAVPSPRSSFTHAESFKWVATLSSPATPDDKVQLRASRDGTVLGVIDEPAGLYICLFPGVAETGFPPGTYLYEILVNGAVQASGSVVIT